MKRYIKKIGTKNQFSIKATSFDGKHEIIIFTPKHPSENEKNETIKFLLHELDDHESHDEYLKKLEGYK